MIRGRAATGCLDKCVKDIDPTKGDLVEIDSELQRLRSLGRELSAIIACVEIGGEWKVPVSEAACFHLRYDDNAWTIEQLDDMSQTCIDRGSKGEFGVIRLGEAPAGTAVAVSCVWTPDPATACP